MKWPEDTYLAAVGSWLPDRMPVATAISRGLVTAERIAQIGYESICVTEDMSPPDMAARAGRVALDRAGISGRQLSMLLHCSIWYQGIDVWPAGSYVARNLGTNAPALDVQQRCNGSLGAVELAASHLHSMAGDDPVLITTADRFSFPAIDRWSMHGLSVYGDGATAAVLSRAGGFARILSSATVADNRLEGLTRGDEPFRSQPMGYDGPIDLVRRESEYHATTDATRVHLGVMRTMTRSAALATRDAGVTLGQLRRVVSGATGTFGGDAHFHSMLGIEAEKLTWEFGRTTGHVGTGDWFAGLEYLVRTKQVEPGDKVLLFGGGAGFTCTSVLIEFLDVPDWPTTTDRDFPLAGAA